MRHKKLKVLIASLLMFFSTASMFAVEEYVSKIYKNIDLIFVSKSGTDLNKVLSENTDDKYYYLIENYTEKKIRRLIVNSDYDFAMEAIVIVIENNLDNEQAVEMYNVISEAYAVQQEHEKQEELKRQQEIARIEAEKEKKRAAVDKEYVAAAKTKGGSVYVSGKETKLTSYQWKASLGLADLEHLLDMEKGFSNLYYGPSVDFNYNYITPAGIIGVDVFGGLNVFGFDEPSTKQVTSVIDANAFAKIAFPFAKHFFIRGGFAALISAMPKEVVGTVNILEPLYTPAIGIKIERIKIGVSEFDIGVDWYAGQLWTPGLNLAAGGYFNIAFPYAELERVKLTFNLGYKDNFFIKDTGFENRGSIILAIGVENVIK